MFPAFSTGLSTPVDRLSTRSIEHQSNTQVSGLQATRTAFRNGLGGGEPRPRCGNPTPLNQDRMQAVMTLWKTPRSHRGMRTGYSPYQTPDLRVYTRKGGSASGADCSRGGCAATTRRFRLSTAGARSSPGFSTLSTDFARISVLRSGVSCECFPEILQGHLAGSR